MTLKYAFKTAITGLKTNRSRSALTILGIVIGIAAIIVVMAVSAGANNLILSQIEGLGAQTIIIAPGRGAQNLSSFTDIFLDSLKQRDIDAILNPMFVPDADLVSGNVVGAATVTYTNVTKHSQILGVGESFPVIFDIQTADGSFFSRDDTRQKAAVAVLGSKIKTDLFGESTAIGERIKIKDKSYRVIGVFSKKGQMGAFDVDSGIMIPNSTAQTYLLGIQHFNSIFVKVKTRESVDQAVQDITSTLRETHRITDPTKDDFHLETQAAIIERAGTVTGILTALLVAVAAISLIVGGIGIMNIMLVSVTERTREIGLRKALGATDKDVLSQFLLEAVILTATGGLVGILIGALLSFAISVILSQALAVAWQFAFPVSAVVLGMSVSSIIGLIFGIYPAREAARKSPIESLRYE